MNTSFIYTRYNLDEEKRVWLDQQYPIIASIATLRAVNKEVKIYVLDSEPLLEDWGDYPRLLGFHVVQYPNQIPIPYDGGHPFQRRMVSRIFDVWAFSQLVAERYIVYADSDIFWLKDPLPLAGKPLDRLYGDTQSDGFFYFNKHSASTEVFVNCWRALVLSGIVSDEIRTKMRISGYHLSMYMCEMAYCYLVRNGMTRGWALIDPLEHYFPASLDDPIDPDIKCLHAHGGMFGSDRLRVAREVIEFNRAIRSVLPAPSADRLLGSSDGSVSIQELGKLKRV